MKRFSLLIIVLLALSIIGTAAAETTYFTCDSDPADFNGKTFDDLYVLLNGCTNLDSTVLPGEDAFVTLKDITVNGFLYYTDDTVDESGNLLREPVNSNNTTADHYLNITGKSLVRNAIMECRNAHDCNVGINRDSYIMNIYLQPTENKSRGKMVLRGAIDGLVDENTDYYANTTVASYPDFDLDKMDFEHHKGLKSWKNFSVFDNLLYEYYDVPVFTNNYDFFADEKGFNYFSYEYGLDLTIEEFLKTGRGYYGKIIVNNQELGDPSEVAVELVNLQAFGLFVNNLAYENYKDHAAVMAEGTNFVPEIKAKGYTEVSLLVATCSFKTDVIYTDPYDIESGEFETAVLPFYIDIAYFGTFGTTLSYDMDHTRIYLMNYVGDEIPGSELRIKTPATKSSLERVDLITHNKPNGKETFLFAEIGNKPRIYWATINGGKFNCSTYHMWPDYPIVYELEFYEGNREAMRLVDIEGNPTLNVFHLYESNFNMEQKKGITVAHWENGVQWEKGLVALLEEELLNPNSNILEEDGYIVAPLDYDEISNTIATIVNREESQYNRFINSILKTTNPKTRIGNLYYHEFLTYRRTPNAETQDKTVTTLYKENVSFGQISISKNIQSCISMTGSCHIYVGGDSTGFKEHRIE